MKRTRTPEKTRTPEETRTPGGTRTPTVRMRMMNGRMKREMQITTVMLAIVTTKIGR